MEITRGTIKKALKVVVYGAEGIGKTTFASKFPNPVFIDTEQSTTRMDVARLPFPADWETITEELAWVNSNPNEFQTLVIDTADWAEQLCIAYVCRVNKKKGIEEFGYGKGYIYVKEEFSKMLKILNGINDKGINVVITAHSMMRKFEQPEESGSYDRWELKLNKNVSPLVKEWADMLLFANFDTITVKSADGKTKGTKGTERVMMTSHHACWDAKNRFGLEPKLPFAFESIEKCFEYANKKCENTNIEIQKHEPVKAEHIQEGAHETSIKKLRALMDKEQITDEGLRKLVSAKGKMPYDMPIDEYPEDFITSWVLKFWAQVSEAILSDPDYTPF